MVAVKMIMRKKNKVRKSHLITNDNTTKSQNKKIPNQKTKSNKNLNNPKKKALKCLKNQSKRENAFKNCHNHKKKLKQNLLAPNLQFKMIQNLYQTNKNILKIKMKYRERIINLTNQEKKILIMSTFRYFLKIRPKLIILFMK